MRGGEGATLLFIPCSPGVGHKAVNDTDMAPALRGFLPSGAVVSIHGREDT